MNSNNNTFAIKEISQQDDRTLRILWTDQVVSELDVVRLRQLCPCALCVDELTKERTLKPDSIPDTVRPVRIDSVGRYAINIEFSDQHRTGIFTYGLLRDLTQLRH